MFTFNNQKPIRKLRSIVCLHFTDREGCPFNQLQQEIFGTIGAVFIVHFPVRPSAAFIDCCILIVFPAICHAVGWNIFHINLNFLPWIICSLIRLALSFLFLLSHRFQGFQPGSNPFKSPITACISVDLYQFLIRQYQVCPFIFFLTVPDLPQFQLGMTLRRCFRSVASILQTGCCPVISGKPFIDRFSAHFITDRRLCHGMSLRIFNNSLTLILRM